MKKSSLLSLLLVSCLLAGAQTIELPTMGWSSWNTYRVHISDSLIMQQADAMVSKGLKDAGYTYVNIDDGYFGGRDQQTGRLKIHPIRFPRGLRPVVDHIHTLGLKAGIYSDAGANTCGNWYDKDSIAEGVGLYGHDQQDCDMFFRELGFDFIKIDFCGGSASRNSQHLALDPQERYTAIRQAILNTGRKDVRMNVCRWDYPGTWVSSVASSWRMSRDISPKWNVIKEIIRQNLYLSAYAGDGHYNDMDMLEVGRSLSAEEDKTHFGLWCMMSSPLLIGCDMTNLKPHTLALLTNRDLIAINQDLLGLQAQVIQHDISTGTYVLAKDLMERGGLTRAVAFYNPTDQPQTVQVSFADLELGGQIQAKDLYESGSPSFIIHSSYFTIELPPHGCRIFRLTATQRLPRIRYEAETAFLSAYQELSNPQAVGTAYYQEDSLCSGGMKVTNLGNKSTNDLLWRDVWCKKTDDYCVTIKCSAFPENSALIVCANGRKRQLLTARETVDGMATLTLRLRKGLNTIRLYNDCGPMPDIDYMDVNEQVFLTQLTVEGRQEPMGLDVEKPRLGWVIMSNKTNVIQKAYHLQVSTDADFRQVVWDSGRCPSDQSQWVPILHHLSPNTRYFWRVKVETNKGNTDWHTGSWTTGLMSDGNWQGCWIGTDSLGPDDSDQRHSRCTGRYLRKEFSCKKTVKRATVHVSGLGWYALYMNGVRVGRDWLTPVPTDYTKTVAYNTYDVTHLLESSNAIGAMVEAGYFFAPAQNYQTNVRTTYGTPRLKLNLIMEYADGSVETLATDATWKMNIDGPLRYSNLYDGEFYDSRKTLGCWTKAGYDDSLWQQAQVVKEPGGKLRGNLTNSVRVYETDRPVSIQKQGDCFLLDFGTNGAGVIRLHIKAQEGDTIRIRHGESLKEGKLYTDNLRSAEATAYYVSNGEESTWHPEFTWFGFRYAEVRGLKDLQIADVERLLLSDDLISDGNDIQTSDSTLNTILAAAYRGIRSNYKGIPLDCPQRDERMPWLGDRVMGCYGESYLLNVYPLYVKWTQDMEECQRQDGAISDVAPAYWRLYNGNVTWPAALPFACEMLVRQYGDEQPWQQHREAVRKWLAYVKKKSGKEGLITYDRYGDWCVPPEDLKTVLTKDSARMTDGTLLSSCYYYYICRMMQMDDEAERTRDAINSSFLKDGCYVGAADGKHTTVTANLLPLAMGIVPEEEEERVRNALVETLEKNGYKQSCGIVGLQWLMRYLSEMGRGDLAWRMATTREYPSWGYMMAQGATTIWELWNGNTANPSMNSGNHVMMLGDLLPWVVECLGGIRPMGPGFKQMAIKPDFSISQLDGVCVSHRTPYGVVYSRWKRQGGRIVWTVGVPANTTATVFLPDGQVRTIGSGIYIINSKK